MELERKKKKYRRNEHLITSVVVTGKSHMRARDKGLKNCNQDMICLWINFAFTPFTSTIESVRIIIEPHFFPLRRQKAYFIDPTA